MYGWTGFHILDEGSKGNPDPAKKQDIWQNVNMVSTRTWQRLIMGLLLPVSWFHYHQLWGQNAWFQMLLPLTVNCYAFLAKPEILKTPPLPQHPNPQFLKSCLLFFLCPLISAKEILLESIRNVCSWWGLARSLELWGLDSGSQQLQFQVVKSKKEFFQVYLPS